MFTINLLKLGIDYCSILRFTRLISDKKYNKKVAKYKKTIQERESFAHQYKQYPEKLKKIKERVKNGEKVRVAFFVNWVQMFAAKPLYKAMKKSPLFDPYLMVIPDFRFGEEVRANIMEDTYEQLSCEFEGIRKAYDEKTKSFIDVTNDIDIICYSTPYANASHEFYNIEHALDKDILPIHIDYSYFRNIYDRTIFQENSYNLYWKVFCESEYNYNEIKKYGYIKGKNLVVTGYCKMDDLADHKKQQSKNKKIIIAPHHSVIGGFNRTMEISNFLQYSELFLDLPKRYPNIDFIFRPHPALFIALSQDKFWGKEKVQEYIEALEAQPNMTYSTEGDYMELFTQSDGIIQDCGSFLVEYFYTGKPQCYMLKNKKEIKKMFSKLGVDCLKFCYQAYKEEDIINFIENIIIKSNDPMKQDRNEFGKEKIMLNYPNVADVIVKYIEEQIK